MRKTFADRMAALEAANRERGENACAWALDRLTDAELELFVAFVHRDQAEGRAYTYEGAEDAAVRRWQELYEYAWLHKLATRNPYYAPRSGEAFERLRG